MMIINPGTEPVVDANGEEAGQNILFFIKDLAAKIGCLITDIHVRNLNVEDHGRYGFELRRTTNGQRCSCTIDMPGLPVERVRWMKGPDQNIWHFPRLYVDGNSWVWLYAVDQAAEALTQESLEAIER